VERAQEQHEQEARCECWSERGNRKLVEPEVFDLLHLGVNGGIEAPECQLDHKHRDEKPCIDPTEEHVDEAQHEDELGYSRLRFTIGRSLATFLRGTG